MQLKLAERHQNLPLHFEVARFSCTENPAFLLNSSAGSFRTVEDEPKGSHRDDSMVSHPQLNGVLDKKVQVQISDNTPLALSYILRYLCESLNGFGVKYISQGMAAVVLCETSQPPPTR